jgi:hypothetical protein
MHTAENLAAALELARAGLFVFPARLINRTFGWEKRPAIKGWRELATVDEVQIRVWWHLHPKAVPGIELGKSRLFVIDTDRHGGADGLAAYECLIAQVGDLQEHPIAVTPRGRHHYFKQPAEMLGNSPGGLPDGIDARGDGGWTVGPGSVCEDGTAYRMQEGSPALPAAYAAGSIPEVPEPIVKLVLNRHSAFEDLRSDPEPGAPVDFDAELAGMRPGRVNTTQCRAIGTLLSYGGIAYEEIVDRVVAGTMAMAADHKECAGWTREAEIGFVRRAMSALLSARCKQEANPIVAPHWVARELVEDWEQVAAQGGRPLIFWNLGRWRVRNMAWCWGATGAAAGPREEASGAGNGSAGFAKSADTGPAAGPETNGPSGRTEAKSEQDNAKRDPRGRRLPPQGLGEAWYYGDPAQPQLPMLVPYLLPQKGFGYLGGQWGTHKTFITNDLAVAIASGGSFAGQPVAFQGAVVQIELEGSNSELRVYAAAERREVATDNLPIVHLRVEPPKIMNNGLPNPAWMPWAKKLAQYARDVAADAGMPLALITIDPQNRIAGFKDEQSSAEGQHVTDALIKLYKDANCLVLIVDHLGKDPDAGLRGTSAKETNPLFILSTGETQKNVYAERKLSVRKMRNGLTGIAVSFQMEDAEVTINQIVRAEDGTERIEPHTGRTLTIRWGEDVEQASDPGGGGMPKSHEMALMVLREMILGRAGVELPPECGTVKGMRGVKLDSWRLRLIDKTIITNKNASAAFSRLKDGLLRDKEIDISHGFVWIPLP